MQAVYPNPVPLVMQKYDPQSIEKRNNTTEVGLKALSHIDSSEEEIETVFGSEEKIDQLSSFDQYVPLIENQIELNKKERKKLKKCVNTSKAIGITTATGATGLGLLAIGLGITSCVTLSPSFLAASMFTCGFGAVPCGGASYYSYMKKEKATTSIDLLDEDKLTLKQSFKKLKDKETIEFIDSQQYENLEDLLILPEFHRYVEICLLLIKEWEYEKSKKEYPYETKFLKGYLKLRKMEKHLAFNISKKTNGDFKRYAFTKKERKV